MEKNKDDIVQSLAGVQDQQTKRKASKEMTQEEGSQDQAKNDGQDVGSPVSGNSSDPTIGTSSSATITTNAFSPNTNQQETLTADTGTNTDPSSLPDQEPNQTITETFGAGITTDNNELNSGTSQEQGQIRSSISGNNADTDSNTSTAPNVSEPPPDISVPASESSNSGGTGDGSGEGDGTSQDYLEQSFTLIDTFQAAGPQIIRSMVVGYNDVLFTASDMMIRKWHKGKQVSIFKSTNGTVYAIDLKYMQMSEPCLLLAHDMGEISIWACDEINGFFTPRWTLLTISDSYLKDMFFKWSPPLNKAITCLCLSDDFNFIYSGSADGALNIWCAQRFLIEPVDTIHAHSSAINSLAVGLEVVFSGSSNGLIKMWRRETYGRNEDKVRHLLTATFYAQNGAVPAAVNALVFCTVDNVHGCLYAGSSDGNVRCWKNLSVDEPEAGNRELEVMSTHSSAVTCLAWCSGPFVFSGSRDKTIRVWRRKTENQAVNHTVAMVLRGHSDSITCIAAQNDWEVDNEAGPSQWILYSGSLDGTLKIWRVYEQPQAIAGG